MSDGLPRKFYKRADPVAVDGGFGVALDDRALRTPGRARFVTPTDMLAAACAAEWDAQREVIDPHTMPLTRLVNVAIDRTPQARAELAAHIGSYAETDLVMHRAGSPASLTAKQAKAWDPLIKWAAEHLGARLPVVVGVLPAPMEDATRDNVEAAALKLDDFRLTAVAHGAGIAGSAVIPFALLRGRIDGLEAFQAACLDDLYALETWGEDEPARERLEGLYMEFLTLQRFFAALDTH